jgi:trimethylamine--corrinoid protein Co-methyltransferase
VGFIEMTHFYDLPSWGYAGTSDSQLPDAQSAFEAGVLTYLAALSGANLCHDVGYLDFGRTGALEAIVMGEEYVSQARRFMAGLPVNEETLALEVIDRVGPRGHFLTQPHTLKNFRQVQWRPSILSRDGFSQWQAKGARPLEESARAKRDAILAGSAPQPLDPVLARRIREVVRTFKGQGTPVHSQGKKGPPGP